MTSMVKVQEESRFVKAMLRELQAEAITTKRVLERVPADKLSWKPQPKSMTLGQLANHIAMIPGNLSKLAQLDEFDAASAKFDPPMPKDLQEVLTTLDAGVKAAQQYVGGLTEADLDGTWRMTAGGKQVMAMSRLEFLRAILLNHWYHHRGQLSVYLRLLDVPVPSIYGPSADENPFV
jgi:uncharacterized damage-inducible protein DinB